MSSRFIPKEESPFYVETTKQTSYICNPLKKIAETEVTLTISYQGKEFQMTVKCFKYGIFEIIFDLPDKSLKYKNKVNIGKNLEPKKFKSISIEKDLLELMTEDDPVDSNDIRKINLYKMVIQISDLQIFYYINDTLLTTLNQRRKINLIYDLSKDLKSNLFDMTYHEVKQCYGLPERAQHLFIEDGSIRFYNSDNCCQVAGTYYPTYGSIPMLHGIHKNHILTVFNNNASDQYLEIKTVNKGQDKEISWLMEGGIIDLYFTSDTEFYRNSEKVAKIVGYSIMPPLWALGYHQCRYGYRDCNDVMEVANKFNEMNIPIDCFWLDIEHTDSKRYFTWDPKTFGNAKELLEKINNEHRYIVTIIDPHILVDENYFVCKKLLEGDCFVKKKNEKGELVNYVGKCWPGLSYYPDFINCEKLFSYYKDFYKTESYFMNLKNFGTWVDMNEPAVFDVPESEFSMPKTNIHNDGSQEIQHKEIHNIFGYFYQKVAHEALQSRLGENKRAFTLTRSFFAGTQENGFVWTGDQGTSFDFLHLSIETNMINCLCGISGTGSDVGGFMGDPTGESMKLWYSMGPFYPFFRGHSDNASIRREPWLWEKSVCDSMIESIKLRYHLLMYTYTKYFEHVQTGIPILKPIWMRLGEYFDNFIEMSNQGALFVFGEELIGYNNYIIEEKEIETLNTKVKVPIYDLATGCKLNGKFTKDLSKIVQPLVIGGSIIPWTEKIEKCSYYVRSSPVTLKIYVDEKGSASGHFYFDDGESIDTKGKIVDTVFELKNGKLKFINRNAINDMTNNDLSPFIPILDKIEIYGYGQIKQVKYNTKIIPPKYEKSNDLNIIDLSDGKIKMYQALQMDFTI